MNKLFIIGLTISLLASCGGGIDSKKLGQEVCDCYKKARKKYAIYFEFGGTFMVLVYLVTAS